MECLFPVTIRTQDMPLYIRSKMDRMCVPCGKCPVCIDKKRKQWLVRIKEEVKQSMNCYFITLTYDEKSLPLNANFCPCFRKSDVQNFFKRLRKYIVVNHPNYKGMLRHFTVGEYGSSRGRPHYHGLIFNVPPFEDLFRLVLKTWKHGRVSVSELNDARIGYVVNYMYGRSIFEDHELFAFFDENNAIPFLCSKKPGIGSCYLNNPSVVDWHKGCELKNYYQDGKYKYALPRYYRDKIFVDDADRRKLFNQGYYAQRKKKEEEFQEDCDYICSHPNCDPDLIPSRQRQKEYCRKFYNRVKKHNDKNLNSDLL